MVELSRRLQKINGNSGTICLIITTNNDLHINYT